VDVAGPQDRPLAVTVVVEAPVRTQVKTVLPLNHLSVVLLETYVLLGRTPGWNSVPRWTGHPSVPGTCPRQ